MEGVKTEPKSRHATRKMPATAKPRPPKRPVAKQRKRRKKPRAELVAPPSADLPYWIPRDSGWDSLSELTRQAVTQILAPAYRQLVLQAEGEVERSVGITLVHLMWLEICAQIPLAPAVGNPLSVLALTDDPQMMVARHPHLVAAKCQTAELLSKVRMVGEMLRRGAVVAPPYLPAPQPYPVITEPAPSAARGEEEGTQRVPGSMFSDNALSLNHADWPKNGPVPASDGQGGKEQEIGNSPKR